MKKLRSAVSIVLLIALSFSLTHGTFTIAASDPVEAFVTRLYKEALGRESDPTGHKHWTDALKSGHISGADVACGFIFSNEMNDRNLSDSAYVDTLYRAILGREAEPSGKAHWVASLQAGTPKYNVFLGFVYSEEFAGLCASYGITVGRVTNAPSSDLIDSFVTRLYKVALGRESDSTGHKHWSDALKNGHISGADVACGFIFSNEMNDRNLSDSAYVDTLYRAILGREAEPSGKAHWVASVQSGTSRYNVFLGFVYSEEFAELCTSYGIKVGRVTQIPSIPTPEQKSPTYTVSSAFHCPVYNHWQVNFNDDERNSYFLVPTSDGSAWRMCDLAQPSGGGYRVVATLTGPKLSTGDVFVIVNSKIEITTPPKPISTPPPKKDSVNYNELRTEIWRLVNGERAKQRGLGLVSSENMLLRNAAMTRATELAENFSHTRPDGRSFSTAYTDLGGKYRIIGENIAYGYSTAESVMNAWMNSQGHRDNILRADYTTVEVGIAVDSSGQFYWVQLFMD